MAEWQWDPTLYSGSASYYPRGRMPYPSALTEALTEELSLDGSGRLLDIGCGPGSLTLLLAGLVEQAVGVDADPDMLNEASRLATEAGISNTHWLHLRAEDLPAGLGTFRLITLAQSFHWMDRPKVASAARRMLSADGACVHVHATTHQGVADEATLRPGPGAAGQATLPHPRPPHSAIADLVRTYLGPTRRAGQGSLAHGTAGGEDEIYRAAGFTGPQRIEIPGRVVTRVTDDLVAAVFSLSSSAPHLFGDDRTEFEGKLRQLLHDTSPSGIFSEQTRITAIDVWRL